MSDAEVWCARSDVLDYFPRFRGFDKDPDEATAACTGALVGAYRKTALLPCCGSTIPAGGLCSPFGVIWSAVNGWEPCRLEYFEVVKDLKISWAFAEGYQLGWLLPRASPRSMIRPKPSELLQDSMFSLNGDRFSLGIPADAYGFQPRGRSVLEFGYGLWAGQLHADAHAFVTLRKPFPVVPFVFPAESGGMKRKRKRKRRTRSSSSGGGPGVEVVPIEATAVAEEV